ncbi:MAG: hypothetical protein WAW37_16765 [Syntrophobacteraceae bacterium]
MANDNRKLTPGQILYAAFNVLLYPFLLFFLSGDWRWTEGWLFTVWFIGYCLVTTIYLYRNDPELLAERFKKPGTGGQKGWDKYFVYVLIASFVAWFILMPLDAKRYGWTIIGPDFQTTLLGGLR